MRHIYNIFEQSEKGAALTITFYGAFTSKEKAVEHIREDVRTFIEARKEEEPELNVGAFYEEKEIKPIWGSWSAVHEFRSVYKITSSCGIVFNYDTKYIIVRTNLY